MMPAHICDTVSLHFAGWLSDRAMTLTAPGLEGLRAPGGPLSEDLFAGSGNASASNGTKCIAPNLSVHCQNSCVLHTLYCICISNGQQHNNLNHILPFAASTQLHKQVFAHLLILLSQFDES